MSYRYEADLVAELRLSVADLWGRTAVSQIEVPCHDRARMDLLVVTENATIAIEAKLSHWTRVVAQAFLHKYCVDYTYIAMPPEQIREATILEASRFGLGVIVVAERSPIIVSPAERSYPSERIRDRIRKSGTYAIESAEVI